MKKQCSITIDVDTVRVLFPSLGIDQDHTFINGLQRFKELFEKHDVKATFFVVGSDLDVSENVEMIKTLAEAGHEIANHSQNHLAGLFTYDKKTKIQEILQTDSIIFEKTGIKPKGFRAPGWNVDNDILKCLAENGYIYDSSFFPTILTPLIKLIYYKDALDVPLVRRRTLGKLRQIFRSSKTRKFSFGSTSLLEIPLTLTPISRLPFYGTMIFKAGLRYFDWAYSLLRKRDNINFSLHLIEICDPKKDFGLEVYDSNQNSSYIPGAVSTSVESKLALFDYILGRMKEDFEFVTMLEYAEEFTE